MLLGITFQRPGLLMSTIQARLLLQLTFAAWRLAKYSTRSAMRIHNFLRDLSHLFLTYSDLFKQRPTFSGAQSPATKVCFYAKP